MNRLLPILAAATCSLVSTAAFAQTQGEPLPAPYTLILMDHGIYENGSSSLLPNALQQTIDNFWTAGACEEATDWAYCDDLLFGLTVHAGPDCESWFTAPIDQSESVRISHLVAPAEDSGAAVDANLDLWQITDPICQHELFRNHAEGLRSSWSRAFPAVVDSDFDTWTPPYTSISSAEYQTYYGRPHVSWYVIFNMPTDEYGTVRTDKAAEALHVARDMLNGTPTSDWGPSGMYGSLPPMPTWVLVERRSDTQEALFAGLLAGSGGTAVCYWEDDSGDWVEMNNTNATTAANYNTITQTDFDDYFCRYSSYTPAEVDVTKSQNATYEITLNDKVFSYAASSEPKSQIATELAAVINADPGPYSASTSGTTILIEGGCVEFVTSATSNLMDTTQVDAEWDPRYRCEAGDNQAATGLMDYEGSPTLSQIRCHLRGDDTQHPDWNGIPDCSGNQETNILGVFRCIRQLPWNADEDRPMTADDLATADGDVVIRYCREGVVDDGTTIDDNCVVLRESAGDITFIDPEKTMFVINSGTGQEGEPCTSHGDCLGTCDDDDDGDGEPDYRDDDTDSRDAGTDDPLDGICSAGHKCDGGNIDTFVCPTGELCDTGLEGRCSIGHVECPEGYIECVPQFEAYPEVCNGLDDDCDGEVDNMKDSWAKPEYSGYSLPSDHQGLHCNQVDVCVCPDGATDTHNGGSWDNFLDGWSGVCQCGEGLEEGGYTPVPDGPDSEAAPDTGAACSAVADNSIPVSFLGLMLLGIVGFVRRRKS